jgi:outer membrane murein-binding lipoprotein Lpp
MPNTQYRYLLLLASSLTAVLGCTSARAEDGDARLNTLERQIQSMQAELRHLKHDMAVHNQEVRAAQAQAAHAQATADRRTVMQAPVTPQIPAGYALVPAGPGSPEGSVSLVPMEPPPPKLPNGTFQLGAVRVTLGGFIEAAGIFRSRNEVADVNSNFNTGIPLPNSPLYHENETRFSARQSRFSMLAEGNPDPVTKLVAYFEGDLLGAAPTANSSESNSYTPRLRQGYAVYQRSDLGMYFLGGQAWSLLTMDNKGIPYALSGINYPLTVDAQYVPGFTWARQPQFRLVKSFDNDMLWVGASLENPQTSYYTGPNGAVPSSVGTINSTNPGGQTFYSGTNYSTEVAPDVILKVAADPGWGHFEVYGLARFMHDRISTLGDGTSHTVMAGGGGADMLLPIVPNFLEFQASFLTGKGIGRYGSAQLPDAVIGADGKPDPLPETEALIGLVGHPSTVVQVYAYGGAEEINHSFFNADVKGKVTPFGYGNPLYSNDTCEEELGPSSGCVANTSGVIQGTIGAWWEFEKGPYGTMRVGPQYSYTHRSIFQGLGPTPKTDDNMLFLSFRYYPFG